jgi:hypothetical protein
MADLQVGVGEVTGNVAHDAVDTGNPVKVGLKAINIGASLTSVAANDRVDWHATRQGVPYVLGGHPNVLTFRVNYTSAQTDTALVTVGAGTKIVVTRISALLDRACSVNVAVRIGLGTATTPTSADVVLAHPGVAPGSGVIEGDGSGILGVGASDQDLRITSSVPTGGSLDIVCTYFTIES